MRRMLEFECVYENSAVFAGRVLLRREGEVVGIVVSVMWVAIGMLIWRLWPEIWCRFSVWWRNLNFSVLQDFFLEIIRKSYFLGYISGILNRKPPCH